MARDGDDELKKGVRDTAIAVGASAVGLAVGGPVGALVAPAVAGATKLLWNEASDWRARRAVVATAHIAAELQLPEGDEVQQQAIAGLLADPLSADAIVQAFQKMLDATTSAAWPCIAALTADYVRDRKAVDGFFRDAVTVLAALDEEGLVAAKALFAKAEPHKGKRVEVNYNAPPRQDFTFTAPEVLKGEEHFSPAPAGVPRALRILGANGFGQVRGDRITLGGESAEPQSWRLLGYLRRGTDSPDDCD